MLQKNRKNKRIQDHQLKVHRIKAGNKYYLDREELSEDEFEKQTLLAYEDDRIALLAIAEELFLDVDEYYLNTDLVLTQVQALATSVSAQERLTELLYDSLKPRLVASAVRVSLFSSGDSYESDKFLSLVMQNDGLRAVGYLFAEREISKRIISQVLNLWDPLDKSQTDKLVLAVRAYINFTYKQRPDKSGAENALLVIRQVLQAILTALDEAIETYLGASTETLQEATIGMSLLLFRAVFKFQDLLPLDNLANYGIQKILFSRALPEIEGLYEKKKDFQFHTLQKFLLSVPPQFLANNNFAQNLWPVLQIIKTLSVDTMILLDPTLSDLIKRLNE